MSERKTKVIQLPSGGSVELKEFISAGEFLDINDAKDGQELSKSELSKRLVQTAIVSLNGSAEDITNALRALPLADYLAISKEVTKLINADFTEAKSL